jgi:hypothetical protein
MGGIADQIISDPDLEKLALIMDEAISIANADLKIWRRRFVPLGEAGGGQESSIVCAEEYIVERS